jgi:hypothetical protein
MQKTVFSNQTDFAQSDTGAYYDVANQILYVKYLWNGSNDIVIIAGDGQYDSVVETQSFPFYLQNPYPNPFNESTTIRYNILEKGNYSLNFYNADGSRIKCLNQDLTPGNYSYEWKAKELSSGLYFICLEGSSGKQWMKVVKE